MFKQCLKQNFKLKKKGMVCARAYANADNEVVLKVPVFDRKNFNSFNDIRDIKTKNANAYFQPLCDQYPCMDAYMHVLNWIGDSKDIKLSKLLGLQMKSGSIKETPGHEMLKQIEHAKTYFEINKLDLLIVVPPHKFHECPGLKFSGDENTLKFIANSTRQWVMMMRPSD